MDQKSFIVYEGVEVADSPLLKIERKDKYGSVPGLDDEELAGPAELERQILWEQWGPVLLLPAPKNHVGVRPELDEDGFLCGAFASADFDRIKPAFDKAGYKAERLCDELETVFIMLEVLRDRIPGTGKYKVLQYLRKGIIELDDISDMEVWHLGRLYVRALRLQQEIARLREYSQRMRQKKGEAFFASLG